MIGTMSAQAPIDQEISAPAARQWWRALMENVVSLIKDAQLLVERDSPGRARSRAILGLEEPAKARWIYQSAQHVWTADLCIPGHDHGRGNQVVIPDPLRSRRRPHDEKLQAAEQFASRLDGFWGV